ncbi:MAG: twin-arginine translocation signal domain-containing protein [Limnobacter sp.]|nr:twin-arginine translocation signal domain-containing protein [Limnobacter sp.]
MTNSANKDAKKPAETKLARRQFLVGAGAGVAAAGAALVMTNKAEQLESAAPVDGPSTSKGYKLTEHVKTYYRTLLV